MTLATLKILKLHFFSLPKAINHFHARIVENSHVTNSKGKLVCYLDFHEMKEKFTGHLYFRQQITPHADS